LHPFPFRHRRGRIGTGLAASFEPTNGPPLPILGRSPVPPRRPALRPSPACGMAAFSGAEDCFLHGAIFGLLASAPWSDQRRSPVPLHPRPDAHGIRPEAAIPEIQAWYAKIFGAKPSSRNTAQFDDIPGVQLRFNKTDPAADQGPGARPHRLRREGPARFHQEARSERHQARSSLHQE
jgi:hypothetical protein